MSIRRWTLVSALVATLAVPTTAFAQSAPAADASATAGAGDDEVTLNNGGMVRGTVLSVEPGKEVIVLQPGTGAPRHIRWADVGAVNRGKFAAPPAPPAFPAMPLSLSALGVASVPVLTPPVPGELGAPRLHIVSPTPVTLHETLDTELGRERPIDCQSPCDRVIDGRGGQAFYFAGDEIPQSSRFHMVEKSGDVIARVSPGNASVRQGGVALIALGISAAVAGAVVLPIGMALEGTDPVTGKQTGSPAIPMAGGVTLGVGGAMLVAGIVMNVVGHTRYDFTTALTPGGFKF